MSTKIRLRVKVTFADEHTHEHELELDATVLGPTGLIDVTDAQISEEDRGAMRAALAAVAADAVGTLLLPMLRKDDEFHDPRKAPPAAGQSRDWMN